MNVAEATDYRGMFERMIKKGVPGFDGKTYNHDRDHGRLSLSLARTFIVLAKAALKARKGEGDGWMSLYDIVDAVCDMGDRVSESGVSARIRDLRKPAFGEFDIETRSPVGCRGVWSYRLVLPLPLVDSGRDAREAA